jgi:acyl-CoA thioester hydrolase
MGHAYYAHYLAWFEAARGHLMRDLGIPYGSIEAGGVFLPVSRFWARLVQPARYDDDLRIQLWITALRSREVEFYYQVFRDSLLLAEGGTTHIGMNAAGRPTRLPEAPHEALDRYRRLHPPPATRRREE